MVSLISVAATLTAIKTIIMYCIVVYIIYYIVTTGYPRISQIGHTDSNFDSFLQEFITTFILYLQDVEPESDISSIKNFTKTVSENFKVDLLTVDVTTVDINEIQFTPLFIFFMFLKDFTESPSHNLHNVYDILKDKVGTDAINFVKTLYNKKYTTFHELDKKTVPRFQEMYKAFIKLRTDIKAHARKMQALVLKGEVKSLAKHEVQIMVLEIMLCTYVDDTDDQLLLVDKLNNIEHMSRTRMGGHGLGSNWAVAGLYISDYAHYIVHEKISEEIWHHYPENAKKWWEAIAEAITSEKVAKWIAELPANLAGEHYKNLQKGDVVEHFFGLDKIVMAFVYLAQVLVSIVTVITDPLAFIKFIIGAILALFLEVIYLIVCILTDIIIAPVLGYVGRAFYDVGMTIFLIAILCLYAIVYGILAILDTCTGGLIMKMLRCENLPDSWAKISNWGRENMYTRTFFCSRPCFKKYYPDGLMCSLQDQAEPTFAPQQVIYQTWLNNDFIDNTNDKVAWSKTPGTEYFLKLTNDEKKVAWQEIYSNQVSYYADARKQYSRYDPTTCAMCVYYNDPIHNSVLTDNAKKQINSICVATYCATDDPKLSNLIFCKDAEKHPVIEVVEKKNIVLTILYVSICIVVSFVIIALLLNAHNIFKDNSYLTIKNSYIKLDEIPKSFGQKVKEAANAAKQKVKDTAVAAKQKMKDTAVAAKQKMKEMTSKQAL